MTAASLSRAERVRFALKPASWPKLLVPTALGQAIGLGVDAHSPVGSVASLASVASVGGFVVGVSFTILDLVFIVLLNDYCDRRVDGLKRSMFPETSPKTIPDGVLQPSTLLVAGLAAGALALGVAAVGEAWLGRPGLLRAGLICMVIFIAYSAPPIRLNYRGGGELLEAIGIGAALPWINAYAQGGALRPAALVVLPGVALWSFASALASGLADEESDRAGGKRTFTTMFGNRAVRGAVIGSLVSGSVALVAAAFASRVPMWVALPPALWTLAAVPQLVATGRLAVTRAFKLQSDYKAKLHRASWRATLLLAALLALASTLR